MSGNVRSIGVEEGVMAVPVKDREDTGGLALGRVDTEEAIHLDDQRRR